MYCMFEYVQDDDHHAHLTMVEISNWLIVTSTGLCYRTEVGMKTKTAVSHAIFRTLSTVNK